jgi:hypothetical protein
MTTEECVERQLRRFARLGDFPEDEDPLLDLRKALLSAPPDDAALEQWASGWIRESEFSPRPAEVYQAFAVPPGYYKRPPAEPACKICGDTGWELVERDGNTGVKPCACRAS